MTKDYTPYLKQCLDLQEKTNCKITPNWREDNLDWGMAIIVEAGEFADHMGYKWWKDKQPDIEQAFIELVDILHFVLSIVLERKEFKNCSIDSDNFTHDNLKYWRLYIKLITQEASKYYPDPKIIIIHLLVLTSSLGKDPEELFKFYLAKNCLNNFRQDNGYKSGTYVKIWNGREDNEILSEIYKNLPEEEFTYDNIFKQLQIKYKEIIT